MNAPTLMETLRARGFTFELVEGRLEVRPASALTPRDRAAIRAQVPDLIAVLTPADVPHRLEEPIPALSCGEPWNPREVHRLMSDADALVEHLGVDGRHPAILAAVEMVWSALAARDLETLRFAVAEFVAVVRGLAAGSGA